MAYGIYEWVQILMSTDVPSGRTYTLVEEVLSDHHLRHQRMVLEIDDPEKGRTKQTGSPLKLVVFSPRTDGRPPGLGEHSEEILLTLGYEVGDIKEMREGGVI